MKYKFEVKVALTYKDKDIEVEVELSNEEVAKLVSGAGLPYEHATVSDYSMDALMKYFVNYLGMAMAVSGNGMGSSSKYVDRYMSQVEDVLDEFGITRAGTGVFLAKDTYAVSVTAQVFGQSISITAPSLRPEYEA